VKVQEYGQYKGYSLALRTDDTRKNPHQVVVYSPLGHEVGRTTWCKHYWAFNCRMRGIVDADIRKNGGVL
jgi:hypothetical protein